MKIVLICAALIVVMLSTATAAQNKKFHSSPSGASKSSGAYHPTKSGDDEKKMPRSTATSSVNAKSGATQRNELNRLEHQSTRHLQAQSKQKSATKSGHVQPVQSKSEGHGANTRFAYHEPRGSASKATSGNGRKRQH